MSIPSVAFESNPMRICLESGIVRCVFQCMHDFEHTPFLLDTVPCCVCLLPLVVEMLPVVVVMVPLAISP